MNFNQKNLFSVLHQVIDIAYQAGEILLEYQRNRGSLVVEFKSSRELVTEADKASEKYIQNALHQLYPSIDFLGEEGEITEPFQKTLEEKRVCWIVDPLDGTNNFISGLPLYAVSIGLVQDSLPILGVVYNPMSGECYYAAEGLGAFFKDFRINPQVEIQLNQLLNKKEVKDCIFSPGPSYEEKSKFSRQMASFDEHISRVRAVRRLGSAALELCYVARGNLDAYWEEGLKPWDVAAAYVICKEAHVKLTDLTGKEFSLVDTSVLVSREPLYSKLLKH